MKIFCSYACTGEDFATVSARMKRVVELGTSRGVEMYCQIFDPLYSGFTTAKECIDDAIKKMNDYDTVLVINTSDRRSEGMLIEVGAALARSKTIIYAQHESSVDKSYVPTLADATFVWHTDDDLIAQLGDIFPSH